MVPPTRPQNGVFSRVDQAAPSRRGWRVTTRGISDGSCEVPGTERSPERQGAAVLFRAASLLWRRWAQDADSSWDLRSKELGLDLGPQLIGRSSMISN